MGWGGREGVEGGGGNVLKLLHSGMKVGWTKTKNTNE